MRVRSVLLALVLALVGASVVDLAQPAAAAVVCQPGTYKSPVNPDACDVAPPGTFTALSDSLAPTPCPAGTFQPLAKQMYCLWSGFGHFTDQAGSILEIPCEPGTIAPNQNSISCDEASVGTYVPEAASTAETDCPVISVPFDSTSTGNSHEIECYDWAQVNSDTLITPISNSTIEHSFPIEFFVSSGVPESGTHVQIRYDSVTSQGMNWEFNTPSVLVEDSFSEIAVEQPHYWVNDDSTYGCYNGCQYGVDRTTLPTGIYDITVKLINDSSSQVLATVSATNVTIQDTVTEQPSIYLSNRGPNISVNDSYPLMFILPETPADGSVAINFKSSPLFGQALTRTYNLSGQRTQGLNAVTIPLSGDPTLFSSDFASVAGVPLSAGNWWVSVTYEDEAENTANSGMWGDPIRISKVCSPGFYSVDGVEACTRVPAGAYSVYPDNAGYDYQAWAHRPTQCAPGTYQPTVGFTGNSCTSATAGNYAAGTGATAQQLCAVGYYQPSGGQGSCIRTPANTYVSSTGATAFTRCPANYASIAGSDSLSDCKPTACIIKKGKSATAACLLTPLNKTLPSKAKVSFTIAKSLSKTCKATGSTVKTLKPGTCTFKMTVTPKTGRKLTYTVKIIATA